MISIIICSIDKLRFDSVMTQYARALQGEAYEVIGVHDAKSMCDGYNRGFKQARGETIIFSHDDIEFWVDGLGARLRGLLTGGANGGLDVVGVAGAKRLTGPNWSAPGPAYSAGIVPHVLPDGRILVLIFGTPRKVVRDIHVMDGLFIACRREVVEKVKWDEATFDGFHCYDVDWSYRVHEAGLKLGVAVDLTILHKSLGNFDEVWKRAAEKFLAKHAGKVLPNTYQQYGFGSIVFARREEAQEQVRAMVAELGS